MRCAVVDIGSNTVRLVIYDLIDGAFKAIWNEKTTARLGQGISETGVLSVEGVPLALDAMARFRHVIAAHKTDHIYTVATAAARTASDGQAFAKAAGAALGADINIISAQKEAYLSFRGAQSVLPEMDGIVIDMGGRSLEAVCSRTQEWVSLDIGPLSVPKTLTTSADWLEAELDHTEFFKQTGGSLYLVGGSWRSLAKYFQTETSYALRIIHHYTLATSDALILINAALEKWAETPNETGINLKKIVGRRAGQMPHALLVLKKLIQMTGCQALIWSGAGIREGVLVDKNAMTPLNIDHEIRYHIKGFQLPEAIADGLCGCLAAMFGAKMPKWTRALIQALEKPNDFHPGHRNALSTNWAAYSPVYSLDHKDRAMFALALGAKLSNYQRSLDLYPNILTDDQAELAFLSGVLAKLLLHVSGHDAGFFARVRISQASDGLIVDLSGIAKTLITTPLRERILAVSDMLNPRIAFILP